MNGTVLITGAAKRLGRAIALRLAESGWDIIVHYNTSRDEAEDTARVIKSLGRNARLIRANLENPDEVENLIHSRGQRITALVNNASLFERNEQDPEGTRHRQVNVEAPRALSEQLLKNLLPGHTGAIVNILDATPIPDFLSAYAQSKKELKEMTLAMAQDMAPRIRVNAIAPGPIMKSRRQSPAHFARMVGDTPLGIETQPEAVAASVRFLLENPSVTGEILHVDGGAHLLKNAI